MNGFHKAFNEFAEVSTMIPFKASDTQRASLLLLSLTGILGVVEVR